VAVAVAVAVGVGVGVELAVYLNTSVWSVPKLAEYAPTAQHSDADTHVTAWRKLACVVLVLGELTMAHEVPSQRSIRV